jgi:hypothetical protein
MPSPILVDRALARRLERAEGARGATYADARSILEPRAGATWREIGGAFAVFDAPESMITQTFGLGMSGDLRAEDLDAIEAFFAERGASTQHEVCPLAGVAVTAALVERGYVPVEMSNVVVRALADLPEDATGVPGPRVRVAEPRDEPAWTETSVAGWGLGGDFDAMIRGFARVAFAREGTVNFLAELDGHPIAAASLGVEQGVAVFAGACTVPSARKRGAQRALMNARLAFAKARGADVAMMAAEPCSTSQHNAERSGFRVAYTRTKWKRGVAARPSS